MTVAPSRLRDFVVALVIAGLLTSCTGTPDAPVRPSRLPEAGVSAPPLLLLIPAPEKARLMGLVATEFARMHAGCPGPEGPMLLVLLPFVIIFLPILIPVLIIYYTTRALQQHAPAPSPPPADDTAR